MRGLLHRNRWYMLGACLLFFGARWVFLQNKPERLRTIPLSEGHPLSIQDGNCYFSEWETALQTPKQRSDPAYQMSMFGSRSVRIRALSLTGSSDQTIIQDNPRTTIFHRLHVRDKTITYLAYPENEVRWLSYSSPPSRTRRQRPRALFFARATLHSVSLADGAKQAMLPGKRLTIATTIQGVACVTRDKVYWIEIDPRRKPLSACASLKVMSRSGGAPQTLMEGISPLSGLSMEAEQEDKIWVIVPAGEENDSGRNIYCLNTADNQPRLFMANSESSWYNFLPVTLGQRVYWKRSVLLPSQRRLYREEVLSAQFDGSDLRVLNSILTPHPSSLLHVYNRALYTNQYLKDSPRTKPSDHALLRMDADAPGKFAEIFRFPLGVGVPLFEGGYVYYTLDEERENILDWSAKGLAPSLTRTLCRYRLPE